MIAAAQQRTLESDVTDMTEDLTRLQKHVRDLIAMRKKMARLSAKEYSTMTQKAIQKNGADMAWLGMEIDKAEREAHAAAVDCGLAEPRGAESYGPVDYRPSGFHHYRHQPSKPRRVSEAG